MFPSAFLWGFLGAVFSFETGSDIRDVCADEDHAPGTFMLSPLNPATHHQSYWCTLHLTLDINVLPGVLCIHLSLVLPVLFLIGKPWQFLLLLQGLACLSHSSCKDSCDVDSVLFILQSLTLPSCLILLPRSDLPVLFATSKLSPVYRDHGLCLFMHLEG